MIAPSVFLLSVLTQLVAGHFQIDYPYWRGNSFEAPHSQYMYPCAGVNQSTSASNRTLWPLTGGSLELELHHPWTYIFVNIGLGSNVSSNFNISLTPQLFNETGNGTLCFPHLNLPAGIAIEGQDATIQVVTSGASGSALYNCADIKFSSTATDLSSDQCINTTGLSVSAVSQVVDDATSGAIESLVGQSLWLANCLVGLAALSAGSLF